MCMSVIGWAQGQHATWRAATTMRQRCGNLCPGRSTPFQEMRRLNVPGYPETSSLGTCASGHGDVVRELFALAGHQAVDVHAEDRNGSEAVFRLACRYRN